MSRAPHDQSTLHEGHPGPPAPRGIRGFLSRHKALLWWAHSVYALGLGVLVMFFAAKGFEHSRLLTATAGAAFILILVIFRIFGHGKEQQDKTGSTGRKVQFHVMTYVLKNLYQGMLFFVLPFYWKSSSLDSLNGWFVVLLAVLAIISTMDMIFDHILMRYRVLAASYFGITLFAVANLIVPALLPNTRTLWTLLTAAFLAVLGFWLLNYPLKVFKQRRTLIIGCSTLVVALGVAYFGRRAIPPVPLYVEHAAVGPKLLDDGRLALEVGRVHTSLLSDLFCVSDVAFPGGQGDTLYHVWRFRDGDFEPVVARTIPFDSAQPGIIRRQSAFSVSALPDDYVGDWTVDVVTQDDQIVGRARFTVIQ